MEKILTAPLATAMQNYSDADVLPFHTPGHKQGSGAHLLLKNLITPEGLRQEVSLMEELDDLHSPHSCIRDAEQLAAELWGADDCLFIINGTSCAIHAMILAALRPNDLVFVPRNSHRSVIAGLILSGAIPIFLPVDFSNDLQIPLNLTADTLARAIKKFPQARALILTSPNYYGVAADLPKIAELLRAAGMLLLVDEAHGAHLKFCDQLPTSALDAGANLVAQSTHKILGSLTQTSMLMIKNFDAQKVRRAASLLQSTSPNYLLLASLDIARFQIAQNPTKIAEALQLAQNLRAELNSINGLKSFDAVPNFQLDLTKITVNVENLGLTGFQAENILRHKFKIQCELSDAANLLFLVTYADSCATTSKLLDALKNFSNSKKIFSITKRLIAAPAEISKLEISPREIFFAQTQSVPLAKAVGKICAEEVTFYPPGIPILVPGELVTPQILDFINNELQLGGRIVGAADKNLATLKIF